MKNNLENNNLDTLIEQLIIAEQTEKEMLQKWVKCADEKNDKAYNQAHEYVLSLQRAIAKFENKAYCNPFDFDYQWNRGAPLPHLIQNEYKTILLYFLKSQNKTWDGTSVEVIHLDKTRNQIVAIQFIHCQSTRFGAPNDETLEGHPLFGKGLDYYEAYIVENSNWIKDLEQVNSTHYNHQSNYYKKFKHYFFAFHDSVFECVAKGYEISLLDSTMQEAYLAKCKELF